MTFDIMYGNEKYTDDELKEALIRSNGQPTKAAEMLGVKYQGVYTRIRKNPELLELQKSARQKTFQDISNFLITGVLAGIMKSPEFDDDGNVKKDEEGKIIYYDAVVGVNARLDHASRLMNMFKGDEGITDKLEISTNSTMDLTKLSDSALDELVKALDEK